MAVRRWRGDCPAVAQVHTIAVTGTWATNDTATITINGKDITFTVGATQTAAAVVAGLVAAWNASTIPEVAEITASGSTSPITLTGDTAGRPFTVTTSESTTGDGELGDPSEVTAATGPNHWDNADNWSGAAVPTDSDDVYIDEGSSDIKYGLAQSAVTLTSLTIGMKYTGKIGLPVINSDGSSSYFEYRATHLAVSVTTLTIGTADGPGSGRIKIDTGSNACTLNLLNAGNAAENGRASVIWKGANASNAVNVTKGSLDIAPFPGETATLPALRVGYAENQNGDSVVRCYSGVTLTTVTQSGGRLQTDSNITTVNLTGGELIILNGTVTTLNVDGGACRYRSAGTITTARVGSNALLDFTQNLRPRTITNQVLMYRQSKLYDDAATVTFSASVKPTGCGIQDLELRVGQNRTVAIS